MAGHRHKWIGVGKNYCRCGVIRCEWSRLNVANKDCRKAAVPGTFFCPQHKRKVEFYGGLIQQMKNAKNPTTPTVQTDHTSLKQVLTGLGVATAKNPGEGALFLFHGAFTERRDALKKKEEVPHSFVRTVYFRHGMKFAVLTANAMNPKWRKPMSEVSVQTAQKRSHHPDVRPKGPKVCANPKCRSRKNLVIDHINGNTFDVRRGNHRWFCNSCNLKKGFRDRKAGKTVRGIDHPHKGAPRIGELVQKKLTSTKPWKSSKKRAKKVTTLVQANPRKRNSFAGPKQDFYHYPAQPIAESVKQFRAAGYDVKPGNWLHGLSKQHVAAAIDASKKSRAKNPIATAIAKLAASAAAGYVGAKVAKKVAAKKANPTKHASPAARKTFAMFHGTKPRKNTILKATRAKLPGKDFAKIGDLVSLTVGNHKVSFDKDKVSPIVVTDAKAKRLFFLGGNQNLSGLKPVKKANPGGLHDLGEVSMLEYFSRKKFDQFNPTVYYHELGEVNGIRPRLMYDPKARQMYLVGGDYKIKPEGIVN